MTIYKTEENECLEHLNHYVAYFNDVINETKPIGLSSYNNFNQFFGELEKIKENTNNDSFLYECLKLEKELYSLLNDAINENNPKENVAAILDLIYQEYEEKLNFQLFLLKN